MRGYWRILGVGVVVALLASGCDWSKFGFDVGNSRSATNESTINDLNVPTLTTAWTATTKASIGTSSPVTNNNVVYIASQDGVVYAFDQNGITGCTGGPPAACSPLWTSAAQGSPIHSTPSAASNGTLFVGGGNDVLYAYDSAGSTNCSGTPKVCQPLVDRDGHRGR